MTIRKSSALRILWIGVLASQVFLLAGCPTPICLSRKYSRLFDQPREEMYAEFLTYPVEKQYDVFYYSTRCRHPGDLKLLGLIAAKGDEAIPFLRKKFQATRSGLERVFILDILSDMSYTGYADLREYPDLLAYLEKEVASMEGPLFIDWAEGDLQGIRGANERLAREEKEAANKGAVAVLQSWLETRDEMRQMQILRIFSYMSEHRCRDLRDYPDLLAYIEQVVASMKDPRFKPRSERYLRIIKETNEELGREDAASKSSSDY